MTKYFLIYLFVHFLLVLYYYILFCISVPNFRNIIFILNNCIIDLFFIGLLYSKTSRVNLNNIRDMPLFHFQDDGCPSHSTEMINK